MIGRSTNQLHQIPAETQTIVTSVHFQSVDNAWYQPTPLEYI
jgi:hypothetical protein